MKKNFEEVIKCDLCGSQENYPFIISPDRNYQTGVFIYQKCSICGLVWISPRPNQQIISNFYPQVYRAYQKVQLDRRRLMIRKIIYKTWLSRFLIKDQLFFDNKKGKILDVGTGNGKYLEILNDWGFEAHGLEISKEAVNTAKKNGISNIELGDIFHTKHPAGFFDVVRFSHVMEHVPNPADVLKQANKLLKKNGRVLILIPNIDSFFFKLFKNYWYQLDSPRHLFHYTPATIRQYLTQNGFKNIVINYNQSPYSLIRSISYLLNQKDVEQRFGILVYPLGLILRLFNALAISDSMEVTAIKK